MADDSPGARSDAREPRGARSAPKIGMVSLGCPKALVDSERILGRLRAEGYDFSDDYAGADAVIVNTCGFLDSAKSESLAAIGEALSENGRVVVTGCLGAEADTIRAAHPKVSAITGPQQIDAVADAIRAAAPIPSDPFFDLTPRAAADDMRARLTPSHYAYLKISEGCDHKCRFCIIPSLRGPLRSRPVAAVLREAEKLVDAGVKELLVISQDTSAYGRDIGHAEGVWRGKLRRAHIQDLAEALAELGVWVRLHYVYPYPYVDKLIPLMGAGGGLTPYLDIPFQHASANVLKAMRRPANEAKTLERIQAWRAQVPDLAIRSTFIVGFPGETDADFDALLTWLESAQLDRVGCFKYENVAGAAAAELPNHVPEDVKQARWERFMAAQQRISAERLQARVGRTIDAIVDEVDGEGAVARSTWDAPEIDGAVFVDRGYEDVAAGDVIRVAIDEASEYDVYGARI